MLLFQFFGNSFKFFVPFFTEFTNQRFFQKFIDRDILFFS